MNNIMMFIILGFVFLITTNSLMCYGQDDVLDNTELVMAFMIHRHGDRTPVESTLSMSTDPETVANLSSKYGYGQLTDIGKRRSYELGKSIRRRYSKYLSSQYNKSEIYIRSTDSTRAKMTVLTAMSAVYPAGEDNWSTDINWTPVPYTSVSPIYDFNLAIMNCPTFINYYYAAFLSPSTKMSTKYSTLLNDLSEVTGLNLTQLPLMTYTLNDVYVSQINLGVPMTAEIDALLPDLAEAAADSMATLFGDDSNVNLVAGVLLNEFFDVAEKIISGEDEPKIQVYSAHDINVFAFTAITRILKKQGVPKYASLYSLELRKVLETGEYIVVPVYFKEPGVDEVYLQMNGCDSYCTLESFRNITSDFVLDVSSWRTLCDFTEDYDFDTSSID